MAANGDIPSQGSSPGEGPDNTAGPNPADEPTPAAAVPPAAAGATAAAAGATAVVAGAPTPRRRRGRGGGGGPGSGRNSEGWLFISPALIVLGLFLIIPILLAIWVSLSDYSGHGSPLGASYVGGKNYRLLLSGGTLQETLLGTSLRNNLYYVILVVPLQTILALALAVLVNARLLKGRGFFQTTFYFPSVTSAVAIVALWLYLFSPAGAVNDIVSHLGGTGPNWFNDPRGLLTLIYNKAGLNTGAGPLYNHGFLGVTWWDWLAGPSIAWTALIFMAVFTTSGTFMLLFIAGLRGIGEEMQEAGMVDGATAWQRFRNITLPMLRPTLITVVTLGIIGCWQVFDSVYAGTNGAPANTTLTPALLAYQQANGTVLHGPAQGAAIAFILFAIIVIFTLLQRFVLREREPKAARRAARAARKAEKASAT